jgi:CheY-specific phosphatase CheX
MKPIIETALDIFERMGFLFGEQSSNNDESLNLPERMFSGTLAYTGDRIGRLTVYMPEKLSLLLAENILGLDDGKKPSRDDAQDAFKEFLNVFCGNALTNNFGTKEVFNMSMPVISIAGKDKIQSESDNPKATILMVEGEPVIILFD